MPNAQEAHERAVRYFQNAVRPKANQIDRSSQAMQDALQGMCVLGLMAMRRPETYGGPEMDEPTFRSFQEEAARCSGALAFLQTQHQSAVAMIAKGDNDELKDDVLPQTHDGTQLLAIGFSQLRRDDPPLKASRIEGGYRLDGVAPWVTGSGMFHRCLVGAALPDGRSVFGLVPLDGHDDERGKIEVSKPMQLAAMNTAQTVRVSFEGWTLSDSDVAFHKPIGWIRRNDMINVITQGFFAIGCARAGVDVLDKVSDREATPFVHQSADILRNEIDHCRTALQDADANPDELATSKRLSLRAWAIDLAARCAHAAVVASSGAAVGERHPAQRIYREAMVYSVSAQTTAIMEATLKRIVHRSSL